MSSTVFLSQKPNTPQESDSSSSVLQMYDLSTSLVFNFLVGWFRSLDYLEERKWEIFHELFFHELLFYEKLSYDLLAKYFTRKYCN